MLVNDDEAIKFINVLKSDIREMLDSPSGVPHVYSRFRRNLARFCQGAGKWIEAIYNLTEVHGVSLRSSTLLEKNLPEIRTECLSYHSRMAKNEIEGMMERLREMPSEWTLVQLTREYDPYEAVLPRPAFTSPKLHGFSITHLPCGSQLDSLHPVSAETNWPEDALVDLIQAFLNIKKDLCIRDEPPSKIKMIRRKANDSIESLCREISPMCIKQYMVLMLGRLVNKTWEQDIRSRMNRCIDRYNLTDRSRSLVYLLAEGCAHLSDDEIEDFLFEALPENCYQSLCDEITCELAAIRSDYPSLPIAKRHPVLLILDEHLDIIPWESLVVLNRHPMSRVPSIHFAHYLYRCHKDSIKQGQREIMLSEICCIVNPDKNLPSDKIVNFMEKRFPSWHNIVGRIPTEVEFMDMLSSGSVYMYLGHGSGSQYFNSESVAKLNLKNVQFLFGCASAALQDFGGRAHMGGAVLEFALGGSGCTLGLLWAVTTTDADRLTVSLANVWFPGQALDYDTLEVLNGKTKKETELLRAKIDVRDTVPSFAASAGFVARGIPIKLIYN